MGYRVGSTRKRKYSRCRRKPRKAWVQVYTVRTLPGGETGGEALLVGGTDLELQPGAASAGAAPMRKFALLVSSEDLTLLPARHQPAKCPVSAGSAEQLNAAVQAKLNLPAAVRVLVFDDDFEEWIEPGDFGELPAKAKVRIVRK